MKLLAGKQSVLKPGGHAGLSGLSSPLTPGQCHFLGTMPGTGGEAEGVQLVVSAAGIT